MGQNKSLAKQYIRIKQQLATANSELAKATLQLAEWKENHECNLDFRSQLKEENATQRRVLENLQAELAVERVAREQAEAQCAAYKKALDIAMSTNQSHETYCKVEAALEGK